MQLPWRKWRAFALREGRLVSGGMAVNIVSIANFANIASGNGPAGGGLGPGRRRVMCRLPLDGVPVIGAFAHLREVDLPRLGLCAEVVGGATAVHAAVIGGAGSRGLWLWRDRSP